MAESFAVIQDLTRPHNRIGDFTVPSTLPQGGHSALSLVQDNSVLLLDGTRLAFLHPPTLHSRLSSLRLTGIGGILASPALQQTTLAKWPNTVWWALALATGNKSILSGAQTVGDEEKRALQRRWANGINDWSFADTRPTEAAWHHATQHHINKAAERGNRARGAAEENESLSRADQKACNLESAYREHLYRKFYSRRAAAKFSIHHAGNGRFLGFFTQ